MFLVRKEYAASYIDQFFTNVAHECPSTAKLLVKGRTAWTGALYSWALFGWGTGGHVPPMFLGVGTKGTLSPPMFHRARFFYFMPRRK